MGSEMCIRDSVRTGPKPDFPHYYLGLKERIGGIMMRKIAVLLSAISMIAFSMAFTSYAQDMTPEEQAAAAVDQRKSLFKTIRYNLGPIAGMAQGAPFDAQCQKNCSDGNYDSRNACGRYEQFR